MTQIGVRVEGLGRVVRALERLGVEVDDLRDAWGRIASEAKRIYQAQTPRLTGRLRGNYRTSRAKGKANLYVGDAGVPYAAVQRWGWAARNIRPNDYVRRGDAIAQPRATASLETEIGRLVARLGLD